MKVNFNFLTKLILSSILLVVFQQNTTSYAGPSVTPIYLGKNSDYTDSDVPPAIRLNEAYDGLEQGTYLYRTKHHNLIYYTPVTPAQYRDTEYEPAVNREKYRTWGPWEMGRNRVGFTATSSKKYYNNVTINAGATIQGPTSDGSNLSVTLGQLPRSISVPVRGYTVYSDEWIYFSLKNTPFEGYNAPNIGRVKKSSVSTNETPTEIFRSGSTIAKNFSYLGNYIDTTDSSHINLQPGLWINTNNAPDGLGGQNGEWSCLGYNAKGEVLDNPYFPRYDLHYLGCSEAKYYDWRDNPFTEKSTFDSSDYDNAKRELLGKMLDNGVLLYTTSNRNESINYYINRFSYLTHPTKDTAVLMGKRTINTRTRNLIIENEPGDFYIVKIEVYDGNTKVGYYDYDIHTGRQIWSSAYNIVKGRNYTVKVQLGNSKNREVLASKIQATIGITKESPYLHLPTTTASQLTNVMRNNSNSSMGGYVGATSDFITFNITAPLDAEVFDIYGLVGEEHHGTDNLEYTNDASYVRMYTVDAFEESTETISKGNLKATSIELLDASNNSVVYSSTGNIINTAIIPNKSYKIRYNMKNIGGVPTIVTHTSGYERPDGSWQPGTSTTHYPAVEIPISYTNTLKIQNTNGTIATVSTSGSNKKISLNGSTQIHLEQNKDYSYTTEALYFSTPYLYSSFTINAADLANSDNSDDSYSTTIQDMYDAVISEVKIRPTYEYVLNENRHVTYLVTYKAKINAPSHIKNVGNISNKVVTSINVGNKTENVEDILIAKDGYQEFSHTIKDVLLRTDTTGVRATVQLNINRAMYETNYDNNTGQSNYSIVQTVTSPFNGENSDTVITVDTSNGSSLNGGGVLNNNCLIPRRNNSWTVTHRKHTWSYSVKNHQVDGTSYSSDVFTTSNDSIVNNSYTESFKIKSVLFKSKETEGKGNNGWVDLLKSQEAELATVKAGYGFELKIISEYRTNVINTQPTRSPYINYTGIVDKNDISYSNEIFVNLPGTRGRNGTEKILSTTGYMGTTKGLELTEKIWTDEGLETVKEFTYTIKPSDTLGIGASNKIFVPTELKNGQYKISIFTPPIGGVVSIGKNHYTSLCDRRDVYINVEGSHTNDLNSNIIQ